MSSNPCPKTDRCLDLVQAQVQIDNLTTWQQWQNGRLDNIEKTVTAIYNMVLQDARRARHVPKLLLIVIGLVVLDLGVRLGPELAATFLRALVGKL